MSTITLSINGVNLDRSSGRAGTEYRRHDYHWQHGHQHGEAVVAVRGDCAQARAMAYPADRSAHDPRRSITAVEASRLDGPMRAYRVRVTDSSALDARENARRAVYAYLRGATTYLTVAGRTARVKIIA